MQDIPNYNRELYLLCSELTSKRNRQNEIKEIVKNSMAKVKSFGQEIHQLHLEIEKLMEEMKPNNYAPK